MIVYRVQHLRGHGPFREDPHVTDLFSALRRRIGRRVKDPRDGPSPWEDIEAFMNLDGLGYTAKEQCLSAYRFGCVSLAQVDFWFDCHLRPVLQQHGYRLLELDAQSVLIGRTQCAYRPETAKRLAVHNLETIQCQHETFPPR